MTALASLNNPTIFIIEDDPLMAECVARAATHPLPHSHVKTFSDAISATAAFARTLPSLIILDILLSGPDGFTFLNEIISYPDTAKIPVIVISSLNLSQTDLAHYGVRAVLNKDTMTPADIQQAVIGALCFYDLSAATHCQLKELPDAC